MLVGRDLVVLRGGRRILDVAEFHLEPGRVQGVVGPNGAGKTTLFGVMAFLESPDRGALVLEDTQVRTAAERRAARRRVTLVEQHPLLFRGTVRENLEWPEAVRRSHERIDTMAERLGVADLLEWHARTLSGGEVQRVALARALLCRPQVLLLDEPTSAGDRTLRDTLEAVLTEARDRGVAVGLATHALGDAYRWSDHVCGLAAGRLDSVTPENLFRADLPPGSGTKIARCGTLDVHVTSDREGSVTVAIPPEDIILSAAPLESSARNAFAGRVTRIAEERLGRWSVTVDAGTPLVARVTPEAVRDLHLSVGSSVVASFKAVAVRVL